MTSTPTGTAELLKAQALIFSDVFSFTSMVSVKCAVELGIADVLDAHDHPITLSELTSKLSLPPSKAPLLRRHLRLLVHKGYFAHGETRDGGEDTYSLTPASQLLVASHPTTLAPFVHSLIDPFLQPPSYNMGEFYRHDGPAASTIELMFGKTIWELAGENPELSGRFNRAMASDSLLSMQLVVTQCRDAFQGLRTIVDVGGGNGTTAMAIVEAFPGIKCTVYDLPHVTATVRNIPVIEVVGGDMFHSIPPADAVFLKTILHDWNDDKCVKILKLCKEAIPCREKGGKVMIVDIVLDDSDKDPTISGVQMLWDMSMAISVEGKEREECEWKKIFMDAGFTDYTITPLGVRSLIEVFP